MKSPLTLGVSRLLAIGCSVVAVLVLSLAPTSPARAQKIFDSPEAAMNAFGDAVATSNEAALDTILGANQRKLIPPVGTEVRIRFLAVWARSHSIKQVDDNHAAVAVGDDGWTLPIPIVKSAKGWQFDTRAGVEEMRARRVGRNELAVMQTLLAIYDAQHEYAQNDHDGSGVLAYAAKLASSAGKRDGLYWPTKAGEEPSPLGPAFLVVGSRAASPDGYFGYRYKLLTSQGPNAPGGAYNYLVRGKLFGGFAVIAWPAHYRETGVKSFMISHDGQLYESDLGPDSEAKGTAMKSFDPGPDWMKVSP
jgi:hypothetical protein